MVFLNKLTDQFRKNADMSDFLFLKLTAMVFGLLLAKWVPELQEIDTLYLILLLIVLAIKPITAAFRQKTPKA